MSGPGRSRAPTRRQRYQRAKTGARLYWWIAGLGLAHLLIEALGSDAGFSFALGTSRWLIDAAWSLHRGVGVSPLVYVAFAVSAVLCSSWAVIAHFACRLDARVYVLGMALYLLDGVLALGSGAVFAAAFHGFLLAMLLGGCRALRSLGPLRH